MDAILEQICRDGEANAWLQDKLAALFDTNRPSLEQRLKIRSGAQSGKGLDDKERQMRAVEDANGIRAALVGPHTRSLLRNTYRLAFSEFDEEQIAHMAESECYDLEALNFHFHAGKRLDRLEHNDVIREFPAAFLVNGPMKTIMENEIGTITIRKIYTGLEAIGLLETVPCIKGNGTVAYRFGRELKEFVENWYQVRNGTLEYDRAERKLKKVEIQSSNVVPMTANRKNLSVIGFVIAAALLTVSVLDADVARAFTSWNLETNEPAGQVSSTDLSDTLAGYNIDAGGPRVASESSGVGDVADASSAQKFWDSLDKSQPKKST